MKPQPLPKSIYDQAKALNVTSILLSFSGGSDEGHLYVNISSRNDVKMLADLEREIENWAYEAYPYSGAGDGSDYGDDIEYDLENNKVTTSEWYTERKDSIPEENDMEIA